MLDTNNRADASNNSNCKASGSCKMLGTRKATANRRSSERKVSESSKAADNRKAAGQAKLRYIDDSVPGYSRRMIRGVFRYYDSSGAAVTDEAELQRIRSLAIPPAYTDVWISPYSHSHLQATGRDARGRKQYRYHPAWRATRDATKYHRMLAFGRALPKLRRQVHKDLARPLLCRERVLAAIVQLLETTLIRVGNDEYARDNNSYGLTTLRNRHVQIAGSRLIFRFRGKSKQHHEIALTDRRLARLVKRCRDLPGQDLFQYIDANGERHSVGSGDVNAYIQDIIGADFSAKDFRTWAGTLLTANALRAMEAASDVGEAKKNINQAIATVACLLGNTPAICRRCYVHPALLEAYLEQRLDHLKIDPPAAAAKKNPHDLSLSEKHLLGFLRSLTQSARK